MKSLTAQYFTALQKEHTTGRAREHSYRPALKTLLEAVNPAITATNEPSREKCGAPDFIILQKDLPIGYAEVKDIGVNLDETEASEQMLRYHVLGNIFLSDYLEFRFILGGKKYESIRIGNVVNGKLVPEEKNFERLEYQLKDFMVTQGITINSAPQLAKMMADKAKLMKLIIFNALNDPDQPESTLHDQLTAFQKILIHDMTESTFADVYAQTIAYGLFVARFYDPCLDSFSRREAEELVPKSNPFLRKLFHHIAGPDLDHRIAWIVDALADVFLHCDVAKILANFGTATKREDPIIHFYETFLAAYDAKLRKSRGVYYTPEPVVSFIVRSVDALLKSEFGLPQGLADTSKTTITVQRQGKTKKEQKQKLDVHRVQILDPAAGTGTFLNEVIKNLYKRFEGQQGVWGSYVDSHLLPRLHGFELMMAPYTMCHLKLGLTLRETGYKEGKQRLGVYLTNSLEEGHEDYETLFARWLSEESNEASRIKQEMPIMVVIGNPPYNVSSANKGPWIRNLIKDYKDGLNEKKINLDDDYIKFLRFAQYNIEKTGQGIVAMITNNSFIDGITHRQMRKKLLETFDEIFVYDLHGSLTRKEKAPDGSKDENVFDIQQGVSISIFVKTTDSKKLARLYHCESYGRREDKYERLWKEDAKSRKWTELNPVEPYFFFTPKELTNSDYQSFISVTEIFPFYSSGVKTERDNVTIQFNRDRMKKVIVDFQQDTDADLRSHYELSKDSRDWSITRAKKDVIEHAYDPSLFTKILYRPFDERVTFYTGTSKGFIGTPAKKVMAHLINRENIALLAKRQCKQVFSYAFVSNAICESCVFESAYANNSVFPLYLFPDESQEGLFGAARKPNLKMELVAEIAKKLKMTFVEDGTGDGKKTFGPEDILDYIYAVLHSPSYREKYKEFLKIDFPRLPFTSDAKLFWKLVSLGRDIRLLHLMESPKLEKLITRYPVDGSNVVEKIEFEGKEEGKVKINEVQHFDGVPRSAWEFFIGGYQPAQKWLKDRKGRPLSWEDVSHYQRMIVALTETAKLMEEIDEVIKQNGGFPIK
ncbi:MAG: N-6 DNA methylase [Candidatus Peribacteraceae bacterium]|nr:N-6 DNA methylase [Candidatus Peribacteraceae bacterium]